MPAGIGTCTQSGMTNSEFSFLGDASGESSLDHTEFQSWIVNFRTEVCSKAKNPTRALQWIKVIEAAKSLDDLITPKSMTGKDFPDYDELDFDDGQSTLRRCYDKQTHFRKKISVEEPGAQKGPPLDKVLEGLYVSKLQDSSQAQTIMALFNQEILRGGGQRDYHRLRMCVKLHIEQARRSKHFRIQSEITERVAVT